MRRRPDLFAIALLAIRLGTVHTRRREVAVERRAELLECTGAQNLGPSADDAAGTTMGPARRGNEGSKSNARQKKAKKRSYFLDSMSNTRRSYDSALLGRIAPTAMSHRRPSRTPRVILSLCVFLAVIGTSVAGSSSSGETKPIHNDHPHRHPEDLSLDALDDPRPTDDAADMRNKHAPTQVPATHAHVDTRATNSDVVVRPDEVTVTTETPVAEPSKSSEEPTNPLSAKDAEPAVEESPDASPDDTSDTKREEPPSSLGGPPPSVKHTTVVTWGIGGDRVGRTSDAAPTPAGEIEGVPENESIVSVAAAGHTALVTDLGHVYTAGRNDSAGGGGHGSPPVKDAGQLGRSGAMNLFAKVSLGNDKQNVVATQIACGRYHTVVLDSTGIVHTFGLNDRGQLGRSGLFGDPDVKKACGCDSGGNCECAEGNDDKLKKKGDACWGGWACRDGVAGTVDLGVNSVMKKPRTAVFVAAGRYTTVVIDDQGDVLVWGLNACGGKFDDSNSEDDVLGQRQKLNSDAQFAATPRVVLGADGNGFFSGRSDIRGKQAGDDKNGHGAEVVVVGYVHLVALTKDGKVFTCDTGFDGYAGGLGNEYTPNDTKQVGRAVQDAVGALLPGEVVFPGGTCKIVAIDAGRCHSIAADSDGKAYAFGCGALGGDLDNNGSPKELDIAKKVLRMAGSELTARESSETESQEDSDSVLAVDVAAGEYFSLVSTKGGDVFGFGDGNSGQLGIDAKTLNKARDDSGYDQTVAVEIPMNGKNAGDGERHYVLVPVAGYQHAAAIVERRGR